MTTGGPAFPRALGAIDPTTQEWSEAQEGMTLRDYFAAKAMQGLCAYPNISVGSPEKRGEIAELCYQIADAMLAAREIKK